MSYYQFIRSIGTNSATTDPVTDRIDEEEPEVVGDFTIPLSFYVLLIFISFGFIFYRYFIAEKPGETPSISNLTFNIQNYFHNPRFHYVVVHYDQVVPDIDDQ